MTTATRAAASPAVGPKIPRHSGVWAKEKLELLRYYVGGSSYKGGGFLKATMNARGRYYLDLFAGSGECEMEDGQRFDGSPVIAAKGTPCFTRQVWVDADAQNAASLRAHRQDYPRSNIDVLEGDSNTAVVGILRQLPRDGGFPVLAFLDPEGSELHWATIQRLAQHKRPGTAKVELFILFPYNTGLVRFLPHDSTRMAPAWAQRLDRLMPDPAGWRSVYARRRDVDQHAFRRLVVEEYIAGLKRLGYKHVPPPRLIPKPDGFPLYFMVFATDHDVGLGIMDSAFNTVLPTRRQLSLLPYDQQY